MYKQKRLNVELTFSNPPTRVSSTWSVTFGSHNQGKKGIITAFAESLAFVLQTLWQTLVVGQRDDVTVLHGLGHVADHTEPKIRWKGFTKLTLRRFIRLDSRELW